MNERPAIIEAAVLEDAVVFAATEYFTVPLPVPLLTEVMETQDASLFAVHAHPVCVVTLTLPVALPALRYLTVGEIE